MINDKLKIVVFALLTVLVVGCGKNQPTAKSQKPKSNTSLKIAVTPTLDCLPLFIAAEKGWFKRDGVDAGLKMFTAHMDVDTALAGGSVIGGFTETRRLAVLEKKHPKLRLDRLTQTDLYWSLVTGRMARLNKLNQFSEKMVAMTRNSATDWLTDETVGKEKLKSEFFKVQINDVKVRLEMMLAGEMDAAWLPEPQATWAEQEGHKRLLDEKKLNSRQRFGVLVVRHKYKDMEPKLLKLYKEGEDSIKKYGEQRYVSIINKYCR